MDLFEKEKVLLVMVIMYAGKNGLDEFITVKNKQKQTTHGLSKCLSEEQMKDILRRIGVYEYLIEQTLNNIMTMEE